MGRAEGEARQACESCNEVGSVVWALQPHDWLGGTDTFLSRLPSWLVLDGAEGEAWQVR